MGSDLNTVDAQESLESVIKAEVLRMYQEVAERPHGELHFFRRGVRSDRPAHPASISRRHRRTRGPTDSGPATPPGC